MNWIQKSLNGDNVYDLIVDIGSQTPALNLGWKLVLTRDENENSDNEEEYYNCVLYIPVDKVFHANNITFKHSTYYGTVMYYKYNDNEINISIDDDSHSIINKKHFYINAVYIYNSQYQSIQTTKNKDFKLDYCSVLTTKMDDGNLHSIIFTMIGLEFCSIYVSNDFKTPKYIQNADERDVYELGPIVEVYDDALKCYNIYGKCEELTVFFQHLVDSKPIFASLGYAKRPKIIITNITGDSKLLCDTVENMKTIKFLSNTFEYPKIEILIDSNGIIQNKYDY